MRRHLCGTTIAVVAITLAMASCSNDDGDQPSPTERVGSSAGNGTASVDGTEITSLEDVSIQLRPVAEVESPVALASREGSTDLYVAEQQGIVRRVEVPDDAGADGYTVDDRAVLDLSEESDKRGEQGLLGIAFSPDGTNLYVNYTDLEGATHVVEYPMDGNTADTDGARELLDVAQPFTNHNGGQLAFGPDGYLYVALGDGGSRDDPDNRAQDTNQLLGKILRIDPSTEQASQPYAVPADNPFASGGGAPEVWLYGVRNPWRFSFDTETGDLWVADVGQDDIEEIDWLPSEEGGAGRGANLGWVFREGTQPYQGDAPPGLTDPIFEYDHSGENCSITGGYVYRGTAIPALRGTYLYGDYCTAEVRGLLTRQGEVLDERSLGVSVAENSLSSFGEGLDGELYVLSTEGTVYRVEAA